jgi:hypothetical protein
VFITVGEGVTGALVVCTGGAVTYEVKHDSSIAESQLSSVVMATLDIFCGLDEEEPGANAANVVHAYLLAVLLNPSPSPGSSLN